MAAPLKIASPCGKTFVHRDKSSKRSPPGIKRPKASISKAANASRSAPATSTRKTRKSSGRLPSQLAKSTKRNGKENQRTGAAAKPGSLQQRMHETRVPDGPQLNSRTSSRSSLHSQRLKGATTSQHAVRSYSNKKGTSGRPKVEVPPASPQSALLKPDSQDLEFWRSVDEEQLEEEYV